MNGAQAPPFFALTMNFMRFLQVPIRLHSLMKEDSYKHALMRHPIIRYFRFRHSTVLKELV